MWRKVQQGCIITFNLSDLELKSGNLHQRLQGTKRSDSLGHETDWQGHLLWTAMTEMSFTQNKLCLLCIHVIFFFCCCFCFYSQFMDDNDDEENQKFLSNGLLKKKKYEEYHEEYVRGVKGTAPLSPMSVSNSKWFNLLHCSADWNININNKTQLNRLLWFLKNFLSSIWKPAVNSWKRCASTLCHEPINTRNAVTRGRLHEISHKECLCFQEIQWLFIWCFLMGLLVLVLQLPE